MTEMNDLLYKIRKVMGSALQHASRYLEAEFDLAAESLPPTDGDIKELTLREMTAIIGIGGTIDLYVAFSFEDSLVQRLFEQMAEGLEIAPEEEQEMKQATVGEIVNIIMGHCTTDLQQMDSKVISITPPTVLNLVKTVPKLKNAVFHLRSLVTKHGAMDVYLIGPKELFSNSLDYIE